MTAIDYISKIQGGVPIPSRNQRISKWKAVVNAMNINDSFLVESAGQRDSVLRHNTGRVTSRKIDGKGYRIWRIK